MLENLRTQLYQQSLWCLISSNNIGRISRIWEITILNRWIRSCSRTHGNLKMQARQLSHTRCLTLPCASRAYEQVTTRGLARARMTRCPICPPCRSKRLSKWPNKGAGPWKRRLWLSAKTETSKEIFTRSLMQKRCTCLTATWGTIETRDNHWWQMIARELLATKSTCT